MDAMEILVIILSTFLAIFLLLAIILTVQLIRITKQIEQIAVTTQATVDRVNDFTATASRFISPLFLIRYLAGQFRKSSNKSR